MKKKLNIFKFGIECYKQVEQKKKMKKNGVICVVFMFPSSIMILKLLKKAHLFNFVLTWANKFKYAKASYIYGSETSRYTLSENVIVCYAMTECFEDISVWNRRTLSNFCWVSIVFDILIANISWTVAQTPISHIIFWKTVIKSFRFIYEIALTGLGFWLKSAQNCRKWTFMDNLRIITQGESMSGEWIMELKTIPKFIKVSVTSFDKFHLLCNLYIFGLCFVVQ